VVGAVPRELQRLTVRVDRTVAQLVRRLWRQPTVTELARAVGVTEERVLEALEASRRAGRASATSWAPRRPVRARRAPRDLGRLLRVLTPREREVVALRFEFDLAQAEIGERIGVSQMQVSRFLRGAMARLHVLVGEAA
jgi:RNA polymerase sigma-B factor